MAMMRLSTIVALVASVSAQDYLEEPEELWTAMVSPPDVGNGCSLAPSSALLVCTGADGSLSALNAYTGAAAWDFVPEPAEMNPHFCTSGVTFSSHDETGDYVLYGVSEGFVDADPAFCRVYAVSLDGDLLWRSDPIDGACSGTPVASSDGSFAFITSKQVDAGTFTILDAADDGNTLYDYDDDRQPFGPLGIHFEPSEGYYATGSGNRNDILIWSSAPNPGEDGVNFGAMFGFQFPTDGGDVEAIELLNTTDFQSIAPPLITNSGYRMYWGVSRSNVRGWLGEMGDVPNMFDRTRATANRGFERAGTPYFKSQAVFAKLTASHDEVDPNVYGGTAGVDFVAFDADFDLMWTVQTDLPVFMEAKVSPDNERVYFIEQGGVVHAVDADDGDEIWSEEGSALGVVAGFDQNEEGSVLYFCDASGIVRAWQVAEMSEVPTVLVPGGLPLNETAIPTSNETFVPPVVDETETPVVTNETGVPSNITTVFDIITSVPVPPLQWLPSILASIGATEILEDPSSSLSVFVPSDEALSDALGQEYLLDLATRPEYAAHAECLISYHVAPNFVAPVSAWSDEQQEVSSAYDNEPLFLTREPTVAVNDVPIMADFDHEADNGMVHFIDSGVLLLPCVTDSILATGFTDATFSTLVGMVQKAGLGEALDKQRPLTLFAPTNEAFAALDQEIIDYLDENVKELQKLLFYHIVTNVKLLEETEDQGVFTTAAQEAPIMVAETSTPGEFTVNGYEIEQTNVLAKNGVIHVVSKVLLPPDFPFQYPVTEPPVDEPTDFINPTSGASSSFGVLAAFGVAAFVAILIQDDDDDDCIY